MYETYTQDYRKKTAYTSYRKLSLTDSSLPFFAAYPSYPSYLGVGIIPVDKKYTGSALLGFTNGKFIAMQRGLPKTVKLFVRLHEEEHVKDMSATEKEVDKRALKRLMLLKKPGSKELAQVKKLLRQRWHGLGDFSFCASH